MLKVFFVGLGGFIGAVLRYFLSYNLPKLIGSEFPYATLIVNVIGSFIIGFIMEISGITSISEYIKLFLTVGLLGALTTFSTFSYETIMLFKKGSYLIGFLNICLNLALSFIGVILSKYLVQWIFIK